jgi:predicted Zn-dependent protease
MIKYTAKEIKGNVNVSSVSPLKDFFGLVLKIIGVLLLIYIALGFLVDYMAPRISIDTEIKLGKLFASEFEKEGSSEAENEVRVVLDRLIKNADSLPKFNYKVHIRESKDINALALPGGHIVLLSGLLKEVNSENELAMVLAHELGHFVHRDHLRGLGRSLVFLLLSSMFFGTDSQVSKFITTAITNAEMKFSQAQEKAADLYALQLLNRTYGQVAGAIDFYEKIAAREKLGWFFYLFATHPYPKSRIAALKEAIREKNYKIGEKTHINNLNFTGDEVK